MSVYRGKCFCGATEITVDGEPVGAGYCHCASLQKLVGRPRQCLHPLEAGGGESDQGREERYAQTVLRMKDGLPKLKDFPPELGGTGEIVPE